MLKKSLLFLISLCLSYSTIAQSKKYTQVFHEFYDDKPLHFGFQFGLSSARYFVAKTTNQVAISSPKTGFFVGGNANYSINQYFEVKSGLNVALYSRSLMWPSPIEFDTLTRETVWAELPILIKFRSTRRKNHRGFLVAGAKFSWESNKRASTNLMGKQYDITIEYGFGFEKFNRFFKFSPEIRFSNGILNLYNPTTGISFDPVLRSNTISLILNFE